MSDRPDGQPRRYGLTSDDDWFSAPSPRRSLPPTDEWLAADSEPAPFDHDAPAWHDEDDGYDDPHDERPVAGHPFGDRRWTPIVAAVGIVVVIVVAIVVVRSLGGSDPGTSAATSPTFADTSIDTTAIDTTATDTTATDTTATDTTATDTTATDTTATDTTRTDTTGGTATTTTPTTTTVTEVPTGQSLKPGMSGSSVLALQQALVQLGYDPGTPDGSYGPGTTQAVTAFQGSNELTQDGVAGPATLDAINAQLSRG